MKTNNPTINTIINDVQKEMDDKFWELDDKEYYLEDRGRWMSNLIQRDGLEEQTYDSDIHSICWSIFQRYYLGNIIYEDDNGNIINYKNKSNVSNDKKDRVLKEDGDTQFDEELGMIGTIFLKYSYDTLPINKRLENLKNFRLLVRDNLKDKGMETMDFPTIKQYKLKRDLEDSETSEMTIDTLDKFVDETNFDIENYLNKIGFTKLQMVDFFKDLLEYTE
jgi:hypothetical protein